MRLKVQRFAYEVFYNGNSLGMVESAVIVIPDALRYPNGTLLDAVVIALDEDGKPITFTGVDEAQRYIDRYKDVIKLKVEDGNIYATLGGENDIQ